MANFIPLKNYMFFCLDRVIADYNLSAPFLDLGCGVGDLSKYLAEKGWQGTALDSSGVAIERTQKTLAGFPNVKVYKKPLFEESGFYRTILLWDVLEHISDDESVLRKISSLLLPGGYVLIAVPSNPKEWRWDDDFYGHFRRYTEEDLRKKIINAGLSPVSCFDFTFPIFWIMRRMYTKWKKPSIGKEDKNEKTGKSSTVNAWDIPFVSGFFNRPNFFWNLIYRIQFKFFKNMIKNGHEMFVLARKNA